MTEIAEPVETYLVCGFLGAGKTTFILEQLNQADANVAVLVNEFGTLGIDGEVIRLKGGVEVVEMPGGCICCSRKADFSASVKAIVETKRPDLLLIEPSGVAQPPEILQALRDETLSQVIELRATIAVIDATTFEEFFEGFGAFFRTQIVSADVIIVNKRDLVDRDTLETIKRRVGALNSRAQVIVAERCRIDLPVSAAGGSWDQGRDHVLHDNGLGLDAISFELAQPLSNEELDRFVSELSAGSLGEVLRAKGFIEMRDGGFMSLQVTSGEISAEPLEVSSSSRVTVIGRGLKEEAIADRLGTSRR